MYVLVHTTDLDSYIWGFGRLWGLFDKREVKIRITGKRIVPLKRLKELVTYDKKHATHAPTTHCREQGKKHYSQERSREEMKSGLVTIELVMIDLIYN